MFPKTSPFEFYFIFFAVTHALNEASVLFYYRRTLTSSFYADTSGAAESAISADSGLLQSDYRRSTLSRSHFLSVRFHVSGLYDTIPGQNHAANRKLFLRRRLFVTGRKYSGLHILFRHP